jgi:hypothetical protein
MAGMARRGAARCGKARPGRAGRGVARHGLAWQARRGWAWQGVARQGAAGGETKAAPGESPGATNQKEYDMAASKNTEQPQVVLDHIAAETVRVPIVGTSPLIVHRFSEKAKRQMLDNMQGRKSPKEPKNPDAECEAAFYKMTNPDGYGFPCIAFKAATVGGARFYSAVTMTALKQFMFFRGEIGVDGQALVRLKGEPKMREDVVKVGRNGTDLRYRPEFAEWSTTLTVTYVTSMLSRGSVLSLIDAGGMGIGVGEWRPEKDGDYGCYRIDQDHEIEVLTGAGR